MTARAKGGMVLEDGPAAGTYSVRRAPRFLRAVVGPLGADLLDQLTDSPRHDETVHVYEATGPTWDSEGWARRGIIVCPPPGASGHYRHRSDVDGATVRSTDAWRTWATAQPATGPVTPELSQRDATVGP